MVLPVLPLTSGVVFPDMVVTVAAESERAKQVASENDSQIFLLPRIDGNFSNVGVIATVEDKGRLPNGNLALTLRAQGRARAGVGVRDDAQGLWLEVHPIEDPEPTPEQLTKAQQYRAAAAELMEHLGGGRRFVAVLDDVDHPGALADTIAHWPELTLEQRVQLIEAVDVDQRLDLATTWLMEALADLTIRAKIRSDVEEGLEETQRKAILQRQLAAIRAELGEDVDGSGAVEEYRTQLEGRNVDESVRTAIATEIDRLERTGEQSMESSWIRSWLDQAFEIPWEVNDVESDDLTAAREILDADHTGLDEVKERLVEHLAVRSLRRRRSDAAEPVDARLISTGPSSDAPLSDLTEASDDDVAVERSGSGVAAEAASVSEHDTAPPAPDTNATDGTTERQATDPTPHDREADTGTDAADDAEPPVAPTTAKVVRAVKGRDRGVVLALVGPPGVGKTSLGESVARALGRKFVRVALGGMSDETEIRGHRRTYVGARAGRIARALSEAGTMNPVILLDEIDKVGGGWRGDPSAALLEVLDPAQNHTFRDHYLDIDLDLSDVVFIATANVLETIPGPLLDRMEIISIEGYTETEKVTIAREHLLDRVRSGMGLADDEVDLSDEALERIVSEWTREPGVRRLERQLDKAVRKVATRIADGSDEGPITIEADELDELLGKPIPSSEKFTEIDQAGIATGLAVTGAGGDVLYVETARIPGEPGMTLTGQLGDVMQESASLARSWLMAHGPEHGIELSPEQRLHVHFPAGAVPKDGPSAGVTMTTALASLLTGRKVRSDVAMTGEISLGGRVLPIGGVSHKLLAAHRQGITTVIIPKANERDLDDLADEVRAELEIHPVSSISEVLGVALEPLTSV